MERRFNVWVYIEQDAADPTVWVAHCLDLDIVSWGDSPGAARAMVHEAVELCLLDDLNQGLEPTERSKAPQEDWDKLHVLQQVGRRVDLSAADVVEREQVTRFAVQIPFVMVPMPAPAVRLSPDAQPPCYSAA